MTAPITDVVNVSIVVQDKTPAQAGFGVPMVYGFHTHFSEHSRVYSDLAGLTADGFTVADAVYRAASAIFAQNPRPESIVVGRAATGLGAFVSTLTPTVLNLAVYTVTIGAGSLAKTYSFTSDSTATAAEIAAGLIALINVDTGSHGITASGSTTVVLTHGTPGVVPAVAYSSNLSSQNTTPAQTSSGFAADLQAIRDENDAWYALIPVGYGHAEIADYAAVIEPLAKVAFVVTDDADVLTTATTDTASAAKTLNYARTAVWFSRTPAAYLNAAMAGVGLPQKPGSITYAYKTPVGVPTENLTATQRTNLRAKNASWFETVSGLDVTFEGKMAGGRYIDTTIGIDSLQSDIGASVLAVMAAAPKVPFTDGGIRSLKTALDAAGARAETAGVLVPGTFSSTAPTRAQTTTLDRAARTLRTLTFTGQVAGAIHKTTISGTVTV